MQKKSLVVLLLTLVLICGLLLVACDGDKSTHKGKIEVDVADANAFLAMNDTLGDDYDEAKFKLTAPITLAPASGEKLVAPTKENPFCGTFDGGNHKITLTVKNESERFVASEVVALFGYTKGATFQNINLSINYQLDAFEETSFFGGLVGVAFGNTTIQNVTVDGTIDARPSYEKETDENGYEISHPKDKNAYMGGVVAYSTGVLTLKNTTSSVQLTAATNAAGGRNSYGFYDAFLGTAAAYIRSNDVSLEITGNQDANTTANRNQIDTLSVEPNITAYGRNLFVGGAVGRAYRLDAKNITVSASRGIAASGARQNYLGGAFGFLDNTAATAITVKNDLTLAPFSAGGVGTANSVGGVVGFMNNGSTLKTDVSYEGTIYTKAESASETYGGGLVGTMRDSHIDGGSVKGGFVVGDDGVGQLKTPTDFAQKMQTSPTHGYLLHQLAGVAGSIYGNTSLANIACDFVAYQGVVAKQINSIKIGYQTNQETGKEEVTDVTTLYTPTVQASVRFVLANSGAEAYKDSTGSPNATYLPNNVGSGVTELANHL